MLSGSNSNSCRWFAEFEFSEGEDKEARYLCFGDRVNWPEDANPAITVECPAFEHPKLLSALQPVPKEVPKKPVVKSKQKGGEVAKADRAIKKVVRKMKNAFTVKPTQSDIEALLALKRNHKVG